MGRTRVIDREAVLLAAERVVMREGAARVTLEAVAAEAGISKASVLYDYKTKRALLQAVIEHRVSAHADRLRRRMDEIGPVANSAIRARIAVSNRAVSEADRAVALNLIAALAQDAELRAPVQKAYKDQIAEIRRTSSSPRAAMLAFLAIEGLNLLEYFGLYTWPKAERSRLVADIESLVEDGPPASAQPH